VLLFFLLTATALLSSSGANEQVTIAFTSTHSEWWKIPLHLPHLIKSAAYPFSRSILYITAVDDVYKPQCATDRSALEKEISYTMRKIIEDGWVDEIREIKDTKKLLKSASEIIESPNEATVRSKDFLALVQFLEDCVTAYCAHLDLGTCFPLPPPLTHVAN